MGWLDKAVDFFQDLTSWIFGIEDVEQGGTTINKKASNAPVPIAYGEHMLRSPNIDYVETTGKNNRYAFIAASFCMGEIDDFLDIFLDDKPLSEFPAPNVSTYPNFNTYDGDDVVVIRKYPGLPDQTADAMLMTQSKWTAAHRFQGIAYLAIRLRYKEDHFAGIPQISAVGRWKKVMDQRTGQVVFTKNHALCYRDYVQSTVYGRGLQDSELDAATWNEAADDCDEITTLVVPQQLQDAQETVTIGGREYLRWDVKPDLAYSVAGSQVTATGKTGTAGAGFMSNGWFGFVGGYYLPVESETGAPFDETDNISLRSDQSLYECNMLLNGGADDQTVFKNAERMRSEMRAFQPRLGDGKYYLLIDKDRPPVFDLQPEDVVGGFSWEAPGKDKYFNRVTVKFTNPNINWKEDRAIYPEPGSAVETALLAEDNGTPLHKEVTVESCSNKYQATEIARLMLYKSRNALKATFTVFPRFIEYTVGDVGAVTWPSMGWNGKLFQIGQMGLAASGEVGLQLVEFEPAIYNYEAVPLDLLRNDTDLPDPFFINQVQNVFGTSVGDRVEGMGISISIDLTWDVLDDATVDQYEIRYRIQGEVNWNTVFSRENTVNLLELKWLRIYEIQVRGMNTAGNKGEWSAQYDHPIIFDTTPPDLPVIDSVVGTAEKALTVKWTNPADLDFKLVQVFYSTIDSLPGLPAFEAYGNETIISGLQRDTTYFVWLKSVDDTGNASAATPSSSGRTLQGEGAAVYESDTMPPGTGYNVGDIWEKTPEGTLYEWDGDSWELHTPPDPSGILLAKSFREDGVTFVDDRAWFAWDKAPLSVYNFNVEVWWTPEGGAEELQRTAIMRNRGGIFAGALYGYNYGAAIDDEPNTSGTEDRITNGARSFKVRVYTLAPDDVTRSLNYVELAVSNPQMGLLGGITVEVDDRSVNVSHDTPEGSDFGGIEVHGSTSSSYTPGPATLLRTIYAGSGTQEVRAFLNASTTYYIKVGAFDNWGKDGIVYSGNFTVTTPDDFGGLAYLGSVGSGQINSSAVINSKLGSNAVSRNKVGAGELVETHTVLNLGGASAANPVDNTAIVPLTYNFTAEADGLIVFQFFADCTVLDFEGNTYGSSPVIVCTFEIGVGAGTYLCNTSMYLPLVLNQFNNPVGTTDWKGFVNVSGTSQWSGFPSLSGGESITVKPKFFYFSVDNFTDAGTFTVNNCQAVIEELNNT